MSLQGKTEGLPNEGTRRLYLDNMEYDLPEEDLTEGGKFAAMGTQFYFEHEGKTPVSGKTVIIFSYTDTSEPNRWLMPYKLPVVDEGETPLSYINRAGRRLMQSIKAPVVGGDGSFLAVPGVYGAKESEDE